MKSKGYARFAGAMLAVASYLLWIVPDAQAGSVHSHDGIYAVHVLTQHGSCTQSRMTTIAVISGHVHATGHGLMRASGRVAPDGKVLGNAPAFAPHRTCCGQVERSFRFWKLDVQEFGLPGKLARQPANVVITSRRSMNCARKRSAQSAPQTPSGVMPDRASLGLWQWVN